MRVLHVIASLSPEQGGTTSSVVELIASLEKKGVSCEVALSDDDGLNKRIAKDAPDRDIPGRHYFPKQRELYSFAPAMGPWLKKNVEFFSLVHIHGLFSYANGLAGRICRRLGVPYVVTPHGMANRYGMRHNPVRKLVSFVIVERALLEGAAAIHVTSQGEERDFADLGVRAPVARIPLAVSPLPLGDGEAFRARHPEIDDSPIAVFFGRINPIKNLEAAIDALAVAGSEQIHLVVCGDGPNDYVRQLRARSVERGVANRISWLGFVTGDEKADVLAAGDVYIQPSLSESFGIAAVEAVSVGMPCVLGENVAISEDLMAAGFAIAVPPTAESIAEGIEGIIRGERGPRYKMQAREFVSSCFSQDSIGSQLLALYERATLTSSKHLA